MRLKNGHPCGTPKCTDLAPKGWAFCLRCQGRQRRLMNRDRYLEPLQGVNAAEDAEIDKEISRLEERMHRIAD